MPSRWVWNLRRMPGASLHVSFPLDKYGLACSHDCKGCLGSKGDLSTHSTFVMSTSAEIALWALWPKQVVCLGLDSRLEQQSLSLYGKSKEVRVYR